MYISHRLMLVIVNMALWNHYIFSETSGKYGWCESISVLSIDAGFGTGKKLHCVDNTNFGSTVAFCSSPQKDGSADLLFMNLNMRIPIMFSDFRLSWNPNVSLRLNFLSWELSRNIKMIVKKACVLE